MSAQRLIAFLALRRQSQTRAFVAGNLWPDTSQRRSAANLRSTLWRLQNRDATIVRATSSHVELTDSLTVDVAEIEATVHRLIGPSTDAADGDLRIAALAGELLPDWHADDWILLERERLRQLCLHGLDAACERLCALGRFGEAIEAAMTAICSEPLRESAHRLLITVHVAEGNHSEALRQYHWYARLLRDELGIEPSDQIRALVGSLRRRG